MKFLEGEINIILGKNGEGKSTLINLIIGKLTADNGSIKYINNMEELRELRELTNLKNLIGICPQHDIIFP